MSANLSLLMVFQRLSFMTLSVLACSAWAAKDTPESVQAASAVVKSTTVLKSAGVSKGAANVPATTGTVVGKGGEREYPSGSIPTPPKPKKEGLEAAGAIKAKAAQP